MNLDLQENMYVRTKYGISQYKYYDKLDGSKLLCIPVKVGTRGIFANVEDIIKASFNIIDILECEDYVNGKEIEQIINNEVYFETSDMASKISFKENEIKSIVTKEQFEQMSYKLGK